MPALQQCIAAIKSASGDALSDNEAMAVLDQVQRRKLSLEAAGTIDRLDDRLAKLAAEDAERAKILAALSRKHAVLGAMARQRTWDAVLARMQGGLSYRDAVLSVLEGTTNHRNSVAATRLAYEARYVGGIMGRIAKERPHLEKRLGNEKLNNDATRLMFGETVAEADPDARYLADLMAEYLELSRLDANALGANIGKLAGYVPQAHMDWRLLRVDKEDWVQFIKPQLDLARSFPEAEPAVIDRILRGIYDTITIGRELDAARPEGTFSGPANMARSLAQHRVLHFLNADAYMAYNRQFGFGNLFTSVVSQMQRLSRVNAMMDKLGPNPGHTLDSVLDGLVMRARTDESLPQAQRTKLIRSLENAQTDPEGGRGGSIGAAYRIVSGIANSPDSWGLAQAASTFRGVQSMAKLGGAVLTAVPTDIGTLTMNLNYQGRNYWGAMANVLRQTLAGRGRGEARTVSYLQGEGFDGIIGNFTARYGELDTIPGRMSRLMTHFFRLNGLSGWTDTIRAVAGRVMAADMGRLSGKTWDQLPPRYQRVLRVHDINEADWEVIRSTAWKGENGNVYITADRIDQMDPEAFDALIAKELADLEQGAKDKIASLRKGIAREEKWVSDRVAKFEARSAEIGQQIAELREAGAGARSLGEVKTERADALREGADDAIEALSLAIDEGRAALTEAREMASAGTVRRAVTVAHNGGLRRGRAEGKIGVVMERLRNRLVDERAKLNERERELLKKLDKATEEALTFVKDSAKRRAAKLEMIGFEETGIGRRIDKARSSAQRRLSIALRRFYADEAVQGVIEVEDSTKRLVTGGTRAGTIGGEAIRSILQFKGFPIAFTRRVLGRAIRGQTGQERVVYIAKLIGTLAVAGYLSQVAKDASRGLEPKDPTEMATITQALLQSGAAGVYGDFLFGSINRFGNSTLETLAGPSVTTIADLWNIGRETVTGDVGAKEAFDSVLQQIPGQNIWWARTALDLLVLNDLRESLSPGYLRRRDRFARETYGQERFLPSSVWR